MTVVSTGAAFSSGAMAAWAVAEKLAAIAAKDPRKRFIYSPLLHVSLVMVVQQTVHIKHMRYILLKYN
ncbi:hypothetical protein GCM10027396_30150 [Insolitispirillum peregrinum]